MPLPIFPQQQQQALAENGKTIFGSFALLYPDQHAGRVDIADFQRNRFGVAQAGAVADHQGGAMFQDDDLTEESRNFGGAEHDGQFLGNFEANKLLVGPGISSVTV